MPSTEVYKELVAKGIFKGDEPFNLYETLANSSDLDAIFETLSSFKDRNNNACVITALCLVANPDFRKIQENNYTEYYFEPLTETLKRYYPNQNVFSTWKEGIDKKVFIPQFHGREHLNVAEWMRALQAGDKETHVCFEKEVWFFTRKLNNSTAISYAAPFDYFYPEDLEVHANVIESGLKLFHELFKYRAEYFVPPNGPFNNSLEKVAADNGIKYISAAKVQREPLGYGRNRKVVHWLGQRNISNQTYTVRNCIFEPIFNRGNWVDSCMSDINIAFRWNKPAIISSHRANYIGVHDPRNRDKNLYQLKNLLKNIIKVWPNVEFMTTNQLGHLITEGSEI
jgi:hypothetical protein